MTFEQGDILSVLSNLTGYQEKSGFCPALLLLSK